MKLSANEKGTSNLEYALVASLISFVAIVSVSIVGQTGKNSINKPALAISETLGGGAGGNSNYLNYSNLNNNPKPRPGK